MINNALQPIIKCHGRVTTAVIGKCVNIGPNGPRVPEQHIHLTGKLVAVLSHD
jgi:hypothetical protein